MPRKSQTELSVKQKLKVLKYVKEHSERETAIKFRVSKTTVNNIKKNVRQIENRSKTENPKMKRKYRPTRFEKVNDLTIDWFYKMRRMDARISGPMLQEAALYFSEKLNVSDFKASSGWLESFKKRHNMSSKVLSGESNDVDPAIVEQFRANIDEFVEGFRPEDIFNADECGLFYKALPDRSLAIKGDKCKSGKKSKERISVLLTASMTGEKLKPFVIGKSLKPRCFKNVKSKDLPVTYTANKKAWMTSQLFKDWVKSVNGDMKKQNRSILLIVDNCPAHPEITEMSNLTLKFLPANTTSEVQPMDRGVIKNFKFFYRKLLLRMVISKSVLGVSATIVAKAVTMLDAVNWTDEAWKSVTDITIKNCFRKAGFQLTEVVQDTEISGYEIHQPTIEIDGVSYDFQEFIECDNEVACTQTLDAKELRKVVLEDAILGDFEEEDLIPLSELRTKLLTIDQITESQDSQLNKPNVEMYKPNVEMNKPNVEMNKPNVEMNEPNVQLNEAIEQLNKLNDFPRISKMLDDILLFAYDDLPEMIGHIESCQKLLKNKMA